jgi:hypothetical protein
MKGAGLAPDGTEIALPADTVPPILFDNQSRSGKTVIDRRKCSSDVRDRAGGHAGGNCQSHQRQKSIFIYHLKRILLHFAAS